MSNEPGGRARGEEEAYRRIASALESGDMDEVAAALGQVPEPIRRGPLSHTPATTSRCDPKNSLSMWDGLRRLSARFRSKRPA
jgi:hypothetical protein